jgi:aspartate/methionine/tyrosine aminotransferase
MVRPGRGWGRIEVARGPVISYQAVVPASCREGEVMRSLFLSKLLIRTGLARLLPRVRGLGPGVADFLPYYSDRVLAAPFAELTEVGRHLEMTEADGIDLAAGSPRFDLAPSGSTWLPADRRGAPRPGGLPELRAAVADHLAAEQALHVRPEGELLITPGASGALAAALDAFVNPGDRVVLFDPTSLLYPLALCPRRARIRWVPTMTDSGRVRFRFHDLARALHRARLLILANPASPTGATFTAEDLEQIAWWAERRDVLLLCDQTFARFRYESEPCSLGGLDRARRRTLTAGSLSMGHGLAAARVGWLAGHRHLIGACAVTAVLHAQAVPTLCQQVACAALSQDRQNFAPLLDELASKRRYVFQRLQALGLPVNLPAAGFFFWVPVRHLQLDGRAFAERMLHEKKVLVWPGHFFGPSGRDFIRLSYLADDGRLREGLSRLGELVRRRTAGDASVAGLRVDCTAPARSPHRLASAWPAAPVPRNWLAGG